MRVNKATRYFKLHRQNNQNPINRRSFQMPNEDKCQTIFAEVSICIFTEINGQAYVNLHSALLLIRKKNDIANDLVFKRIK